MVFIHVQSSSVQIKYLGICHHVEKEMMLQATEHEIKSVATGMANTTNRRS